MADIPMAFKIRTFAILTLLAFAVQGCATKQTTANTLASSTNLTMLPADGLPAPSRADYAASTEPFLIGPYDVLTIDVFANEDLRQEEIQVDAGGRITFPLIGTVELAGKTPGEAASHMSQLLRGRYLKNPQITINLKATSSQVVSVSGEIKKPGIYPVVGEMTLLKAIARAEGWTEFSKKREVIVFRTVAGQRYGALYDVNAIEKGTYDDPRLYANDTVVVGDSQARRDLKNILTVGPAILAPIIFVLAQ